MGKRKILITTVVTLLFLSILTNGMIIMVPLVKITEAADITSWLDTNTTINVTVETLEPIINWYDFQNSTSVSKLNTWIDVEEQYKFVINITSDQGWADVDYINITTWYDNGSESTTYNQIHIQIPPMCLIVCSTLAAIIIPCFYFNVLYVHPLVGICYVNSKVILIVNIK